MNASITTAIATATEVEIIRFIQAPRNFRIDALQGAYMIIGSGVAGADDVRVAQTRMTRVSQSGRTAWPTLIEKGWVPGFREDQLPRPSDELLEGRGEFVVFPVGTTGFEDHMAWVVKMTDYCQAWNAWHRFRNSDMDVVSPEAELLGKGVEQEVIRLARNATRAWPGSDPNGARWTVQEAMDLVKYHGGWLVEDQHGRMLVYCPDRSVVVNCPGGFEFPQDACTAYGLCSTFVDGEGQSISELLLHPDERQGWSETVHIRVCRGDGKWALFPVEELMLRTGSPFPDGDSWPKWHVPSVLDDPFGAYPSGGTEAVAGAEEEVY